MVGMPGGGQLLHLRVVPVGAHHDHAVDAVLSRPGEVPVSAPPAPLSAPIRR